MPGPWEAYSSAPASAPASVAPGPWSDFQPKAEAPADARPDRGALDAMARGAAQGFTANFSDEMRGLVEAGGANPDDPASLSKLVTGALKYWTGDKDAKKHYDEAVARERGLNKTSEEQHPVTSTLGAVGGALALPIGAGAQAATLPTRMLAGAGTGAVLGGVGGVGSGEGAADSIARGGIGAVAGGALGAAAPAVIEGLVQGGRAVATPVANAVRGIRDPEGEAARRIAVAQSRDVLADPNAVSRLTPEEFAASNQSGGPAVNMDLGGDMTRALARSSANTSPEGRGVLDRTINDRFEGQSSRVNTWLRDTFHYPDADAQQQAIEQVSKTINRPAYAKAYQEGDREIMTPGMQELLGSPAVVDAMKSAATKGKDRAITQGYGAFNPGVTVENGVVTFRKGQGGAPTYPNLAFWDATKRELDDAANAAGRRGEKGQAGVLGDLAKQLRGELDTEVPSYAGARAGAAQFFGAENALEAGQKYVTQNFAEGETRRALSKMSPTERQLFQDGFVSRFTETLDKVGDRRTIVNKIAESPAAREKLRIALGTDKANQLEAGLRVEGIMDLARGAVQGNSTTARQLVELGLAGGAGALGNGMDYNTVHPSALMSAALVYGAAKGRSRINENVARKVADLLTSRDPSVVSKGMKMVANNETLLSSLRSADKGLARITGSEAPSLPMVPAINPGYADDKPNGPRPPGQ